MRFILSLIILALTLPPAFAGPPLVTDDPGTAGDHMFEINTAFTLYRFEEGSRTETPFLEVNYGPTANFELGVALANIQSEINGEGVSDLVLGSKYRFIDESESLPAFSTAPKIYIPTGDEDEGTGRGETKLFFPFRQEWNLQIESIYLARPVIIFHWKIPTPLLFFLESLRKLK